MILTKQIKTAADVRRLQKSRDDESLFHKVKNGAA